MPRPTLTHIRQQIARLEAQARKIESADAERKRKAVGEVRALMRKLGVTVADLGEDAGARRRGALAGAAAGGGKGASRDGAKGGASDAAQAPKVPRTRAKAPVKFRDPQTGDAWSGRGRTPKWLEAHEKAGRSRGEFAVGAG